MPPKPPAFVGRRAQLTTLGSELEVLERSGKGRFVLIRGRRRVGKSRLAEEFLSQAGIPYAFFAATQGRRPALELGSLSAALAGIASGPIPGFASWDAALAYVSTVARATGPLAVVVDEFPYLVEQDPSVEGAFQTAWDRHVSRAPVLIIVIGSDLAMMEAITSYGRPLYQRPTREIHLLPLGPDEVASMLDLNASDALDAYLIIGGLPLLAGSWRPLDTVRTYLERELVDPSSPLVVAGERAVAAEFPPGSHARLVLAAIGSGETTFGNIGAAAGLNAASLERSLSILASKRVIERALPLSARRSREARYRVVDPYLRFWLRFVDKSLEEIERGRGHMVADRVLAGWGDYRGKAIEPVVRMLIEAQLPDPRFGDARHVGGFWTRSNDVEIDVIAAAEPQLPRRIAVVGSIKWRERGRFTDPDHARLSRMSSKVPGTDSDTLLLGVSRSGFATDRLDVELSPSDLLKVPR